MWPLGWPSGAAPVKFRPGSPEFGRGRVGRRSRAHYGSVWWVGRGRSGSGERARRRPGKVAAAAAVPRRGTTRGKEKRAGELWVGRRRVEETLGELAVGRKESSPRLLGWAPAAARSGGEHWCASRPGTGTPFKATCRPPSDQRTGGGCLGNTRARRTTGTDRWSVACAHGGSVLEAFPACKASGGA
jgi:hypothetical protein